MTYSNDQIYLQNAAAAGKTYMAGILPHRISDAAWSPWFFTHFSYKNWIYRSETLFVDRWNDLINMAPPIIECLTWNDYGESHYFYKTKGALPAGSEQWVDGFDHSAWAELLPFFIASYKSGQTIPVPPTDPLPNTFTVPTDVNITDTVVFYYRPHSKDAVASGDPLPPPTTAQFANDCVTVIAVLAEPGTIVVNSASLSQSYAAVQGLNTIELPGFEEGTQTVELVRNGVTVLCGVGNVAINNNIGYYNFNAAVVQAVVGGCERVL
jgi:glucan endo-1,3-alpha-glucosidase